MWNLRTNELLWTFPRVFTRVWFSSDESLVYGTSTDRSTYVLETLTGNEVLRLAGQEGTAFGAIMSTDGSRLATFAEDYTARVWDLGAVRSEGATYTTNSQPRVRLAASVDLVEGIAAVWGGAPRQEETTWETSVIDLSDGETITSVIGGAPALSPDGTRLAYRFVDVVEVAAADFKSRGRPGVYARVGPVRIIDVATGDLIVEIDVGCEQFLIPSQAAPSRDCGVPSGGVEWDLEFSPDGTLLGMADSHNDAFVILDATTGEEVGSDRLAGSNARAIAFTPDGQQVAILFAGGINQRLRIYGLDPFAVQASTLLRRGVTYTEMVFTPDGSLLVAADNNGDVALFDTTTWDLLEPLPAHPGGTLDVAVSPDGTMIASSGDDAFVRVWNLSDRSLLTEISFEVDEIANVEFIDDTHLLVTPGFGSEAIVITLDPGELLDIARSRLIRSFTAEECSAFSVDPCPTLNEIKGS